MKFKVQLKLSLYYSVTSLKERIASQAPSYELLRVNKNIESDLIMFINFL